MAAWQAGLQQLGQAGRRTDTSRQHTRERVLCTELCPPDSYVEVLVTSVTICGDGVCEEEVTKVMNWGHKGGVLI